MIAMRQVIPIHSVPSSPNCEFVPLSFFKVRQVSAQFHHEFIQGVHQAFGHVVKLADRGDGSQGSGPGFSSKFWPFGRSNSSVATIMNSEAMATASQRRPLSPNSTQSSSTIKFNLSGHVNRTRSIGLAEDSGTYPAPEDS
jgi:hypothetical protein